MVPLEYEVQLTDGLSSPAPWYRPFQGDLGGWCPYSWTTTSGILSWKRELPPQSDTPGALYPMSNAILQRCASNENPGPSRALRNSISSTLGDTATVEFFLTASATSVTVKWQLSSKSCNLAYCQEYVWVGLHSSLKYSFHCTTISSVEVSSSPSSPYLVWTECHFVLLSHRIVCQNFFKTYWSSFFVALPNSSHIWAFDSVIARAAHYVASR